MKNSCRICRDFKDKESAFQKYDSENCTYLPENTQNLILIKDLRPGSNRLKQLKQCPDCKTYYLYETDYEYLAFGSEDEQVLTRLTESEAMKLLDSI